jgi:hypothetical protein
MKCHIIPSFRQVQSCRRSYVTSVAIATPEGNSLSCPTPRWQAGLLQPTVSGPQVSGNMRDD